MGSFKKFSLAAIVAVMGVCLSMMNSQSIQAQSGTPAAAPGGGIPVGLQVVNACVTGDFTGAVSTALGISAGELRKDVVNGQSLEDIAQAKSVDFATVATALQTAVKADVDAGVAAGLITQPQSDGMSARFGGVVATPPAGGAPRPQGTPPAGGGQGGPRGGVAAQAELPDIGNFAMMLQLATPLATNGAGFGRGLSAIAFGAATFNIVRPYEVAATAVNMKCTDLVTTLITPPGKSIADLATAQSVDPKTVTDALTKAYQDALAQDVTDGTITQAQSDQLTSNLAKAIADFVGATNPMRPAPRPTQAQ